MNTLKLDRYVVDTLMREMVGDDHKPAAFLVYLHLSSAASQSRQRTVRTSHQRIATEIGLSKSAVQAAIRHLKKRRLIRAELAHATATPVYSVLRPWDRQKSISGTSRG
jgi:hypothetical protein